MRSISGLLQIIGLLVIAALGYWVYYANWATNPKDKIGTTIAVWLPVPVKDWGCGKLNQRFATEAPTVCSPVSGSAPPPSSSDEKPATPNSDGSGKL